MNQDSVEKTIRDLTIEHRELVKRSNTHPEEIPDLKIRSAEIFSKVGNLFKFSQVD